MTRSLVAAAVVVVAACVAWWARRKAADAPTQPKDYAAPAQVDRRDFVGPDKPWLVVVFSSASCDACAAVLAAALPLASERVAVQDVEYTADKELHERYHIDAAPTTVVADRAGVVTASFIGPVAPETLAAAVAQT